MSESTLAVTRTNLQQEVGLFVGFGATTGSYTAAQLVKVNLVIDAGLRSFYDPEPLSPNEPAHVWSFLSPIGRLSLANGQADYDLPDDFGGFLDKVAYSANDSTWASISRTNPSRILMLRQNDGGQSGGPPQWVAETTIPTNGVVPTRWSLMVYPTPDSDYVLQFPYRSNPYQLSSTAVYPMGGQPHAETLIEACLAAAEQKINGVMGIHTENFRRRLAASIKQDRRMHATKSYGYNGDRRRPPMLRHVGNNLVTYMGIQPG